MLFITRATCALAAAACLSLAAQADTSPGKGKLSAAQIADRNAVARGGLEAWRAVQTMSFSGKLGAGGNRRSTLDNAAGSAVKLAVPRPAEEVQLPFSMEMKRPRKMRFELEFNGQTAVQVFDGSNGWKFRPFLNRRVVEPYTASEMKVAALQADLDGPLLDYAAKGTRLELEGTEKVDTRDNYKLKLSMKTGQVTHLWIDAETFLDTKVEGTPRRLDGVDHPVEVIFRDYRAVNGLQIPFVLETRVLPTGRASAVVKDTPVPVERTVIERVSVNPKLEDERFVKPQLELASNRK